MSDVLRSTTFQLEFNGVDGLTGVRTFTKAVRDADAVVAELNNQLGENATATYATVRSKKELEAQARLVVSQFERSAKITENLTRSLQHQIDMIGKSAEQQAVMNAQYALGSSATAEQQQQVSQLAARLVQLQQEEKQVIEASNARIAQQNEINRQIELTEQKYRELSQELRRQISIQGESDQRQEISNNLRKLGANATDEQRRAIIELTARLTRLRTEQAALEEAERKSNLEKQKTEQNTQKLIQQYTFLASTVGKTAEEVEQLNAVQALGANATEQQRQQVLQAVQQYQALRGPIDAAQNSLRGFRGVMQNVGWQVQDTVVQLQMGTSAFVVLSQQGSQFAAAFGPTGALIGAGIAVLGVAFGSLYAAMGETGTEMERLQKINESYSDYVTVSAEGTTELGNAMEKLASYSREAADQMLNLNRLKVLEEQAASIRVIQQEIQNIKPFGGNLRDALGLNKYQMQIVDFQGAIKELSENVNVTTLDQFVEAIGMIDPKAKGAEKATVDLKQKLLEQYAVLSAGLRVLEDTANGWDGISKSTVEANKDITRAFESEYKSLVKATETIAEEYQRRKEIIDNYSKGEGKDDPRNAEAYVALEKWKTQELEKEAKKRLESDPVLKAFDQQYKSLIKQTENTQQEYDRRKKIIDDYVAHQGGADDKARKSYDDLELWKTQQLDKEFQRFYLQIVKKTETTQEGYDRQKAIIDAHVALVGRVDQQAADAYLALEKWKTDEFAKEYDKRERVRQRIENEQLKVRRDSDPFGAENALFARNQKDLMDQRNSLAEEQVTERARINKLLEDEQTRHDTVMAQLELQSFATHVGLYSMAAQQLSSVADLIANGAADVQARTKEMTGFQKAMFIIAQGLAAANALISGMSMGAKLADLTLNPAWVGIGTAIGAAQAGAILGVTIAGAFDKGGDVPAGQFGIVSEYGDELVNGMLVKGPARVTSREETARMLDNAGQSTNVTMKVSVDNRIPGAQYQVEQISKDEVKIIAEQVFNRNIDRGVSGVLENRDSKSSKSFRKNYKTTGRL